MIENEIREKGYDCDLNHIYLKDVDNFNQLFSQSKYTREFCGDISGWEVSHVKDMSFMFCGCRKFNGNISKWDVSSVEDMSYMFNQSKFNQPIGDWNVSKVRNMSSMLSCYFNQDISKWNVSSVKDMAHLFSNNWYFNHDITG